MIRRNTARESAKCDAYQARIFRKYPPGPEAEALAAQLGLTLHPFGFGVRLGIIHSGLFYDARMSPEWLCALLRRELRKPTIKRLA